MPPARVLLLLPALAACVPRPDTRPAPLTAPTAYEGRLPCDDCAIILVRLLLEPDGHFTLDEEYRHTRDGHLRRWTYRGRWRSTRGHVQDPAATVYRLQPADGEDAEPVVRAFAVLQGGLRLQPLDDEDRPVQAVPPATLVRTDP
jgi:hypothetical protein